MLCPWGSPIDESSIHFTPGGLAGFLAEDLDTTRVKGQWAAQLEAACIELGLIWHAVHVQSKFTAAHEAALDRLEAAGRLYPCACSRSDRAGGRRAPDGGWAYDNTCRERPLTGGWRAQTDSIRLRLPDDRVELVDDGGMDLSQTPALEMGDPIVRRKDGVIAYHLAVVVDDAAAGITDVIRGKDIAPSTATQVLIQRLLGLPTPRYRHHFLLLEPGKDGKLSKLHGSLPYSELRAAMTPKEIIGKLAYLAGLTVDDEPKSVRRLELDWALVPTDDRVF